MAQGLNLSDFKKSNYGTFIVIALVVLALLFAPDFMKVKGGTKTTSEPQIDIKEETAENHANFENGYFDRVIDAKLAGKAADKVDPNKPGWDFISDKAKKILGEARKQSLNLVDMVPTNATESRFALYNYANGLQSVIALTGTADEREISEFLTKLDLDVSKALTKEKQSRQILFAWSKISISDVLGNKRTERFKSGIVPAFSPHLYLTEVGLSYTIPRPGEFQIRSAYEVGFTFLYEASEVAKIEIYHNGLMESDSTFKKGLTGTGSYEMKNMDGSGYYSVVIFDHYGYRAIKHYKFIPKDVKKLPWKFISNGKYGVLLKAKDEQDRANLDGLFGYNLDDSNVFLPSTSDKYELF